MAEYRNKKELEGHVLNINDKLYFTIKDNVLEYMIQDSHLAFTGCGNHIIFDLLGIDKIKKYNFCSIAYGYPSSSGNFPCCKFGDMEALTHVALALFEECEKQSSVQSPKEEVIISMECQNKPSSVVGDIIYSYKDVDLIYAKRAPVPPISTTFKVGDKVIVNGEETVILGFSNLKDNRILVYKNNGHFANSNYIYTQDGIPIDLSNSKGWFYEYSNIIPVNSQEEPTTTSDTKGEVILRYKNVVVTKTSEKKKIVSTKFKYSIGDKVIYNKKETVILGYCRNAYVIYKEDGGHLVCDFHDNNGNVLYLNGDYGYIAVKPNITDLPNSSSCKEEDKILLGNYKGTNVYCETTPSLPSLEDTFKYSIGDTVFYNGEETCILGIERKSNKYLIWKNDGHNGMNRVGVYPQTLSGCKITISTENGWWVDKTELSPISTKSVEESYSVVYDPSLNTSIVTPSPCSSQSYQINSSEEEFQIHITKKQYHI